MTRTQKVFVTGGTGDIGKHLLPLLAAKYQVTALVRTKPAHTIPHVQWAVGKLEDVETYRNELADAYAVVHAGAQTKKGHSANYEKINVEATLNLLRAAQKEKVKHAIVFSTAAMTQEYLSPYARSKKKMEEKIRNLDLPIIILRPTLVYGEGTRYASLFARMGAFPLPLLLLPNAGRADFRPVHVQDVARAVLSILEKPPRETKTYDVCPETPFTFKQIVELAAEMNTRRIHVKGIPHEWITQSARVLERAGISPPRALVFWACAGYSYRVNPQPFIADYHFQFTSPQEGLRACLKTYYQKK